jgi:chorismate mutase
MNKTLEKLREEINAADDELVKVLAKRMEIVKEIGKIKKENNVTALDEKRWQEVLERVLENAQKHVLSQNFIKKIYEEIHKAALELEKKYE